MEDSFSCHIGVASYYDLSRYLTYCVPLAFMSCQLSVLSTTAFTGGGSRGLLTPDLRCNKTTRQ